MYNNICTTIIPHIILLILGEIWRKRNNLTSSLLVVFFAEVGKVKFIILENPTRLGKNIAEEVPRQNVFSYSYVGTLFAAAKNAKIRGLQKELDNSGNVGTILVNLSKACDCIPDDVPEAKLEADERIKWV